ncbi:MAG: DNA methylase [Lachnospiraceae bacterium]|nr:DNA methylase [Lachnospiraceae bacterium]
MDRKYIAIDLKSYYASVECVFRGLDPLSANLLVADETRTDGTIVLAVSPALKAIGVPGRPRLFEAKRIISQYEKRTGNAIDYVIAVPRMAEYIRISAQIYGIYLKYVSHEDLHVYSIDECFIDAAPYLHFYEGQEQSPAHVLAMTMIRDVLRSTGITATVGIGTNLYLAKIAMDIVAKKAVPDENGVRIAELDEASYRRILWDHQPITDFWQVSRGTQRRLAAYSMFTMGDIAVRSLVDEETLYKIFGVNAEIVIDHAWGIEKCSMQDIKAFKPQANSVSEGQVLPRAYAYGEALVVFKEMVEALAYAMMKRAVVSDHFTYWISFDRKTLESGQYTGGVHVDFYGRLVPDHVTATVRLRDRTANAETITRAMAASFEKRVERIMYVRKIGVSANNIQKDDHIVQLDLFTDYEKQEKEDKMQRAAFEIRQRFGAGAVLKGTSFLDGARARERNREIGGHRA